MPLGSVRAHRGSARCPVPGAVGGSGPTVARGDGGPRTRAPRCGGGAVLVRRPGGLGGRAGGCVDALHGLGGGERRRLEAHRTFVDAALAAGVSHLVYVSFFGAAPDATFTLARDHYRTEEHIRASGLAWTFLRDNLYLEFMDQLVREDGVIRGPAGDGRAALVSHADIARVAAVVLQSPHEHAGATYHLTGPEALTLADVAEIVSSVRGTPVRYHDETVEEACASRAAFGAPDWQVDAWVSPYTAIAAGELDGVSGDVERLTGRRPITLREHLTELPS